MNVFFIQPCTCSVLCTIQQSTYLILNLYDTKFFYFQKLYSFSFSLDYITIFGKLFLLIIVLLFRLVDGVIINIALTLLAKKGGNEKKKRKKNWKNDLNVKLQLSAHTHTHINPIHVMQQKHSFKFKIMEKKFI